MNKKNGVFLNGYYITGFCDGEANFTIPFQKNLKSSLG